MLHYNGYYTYLSVHFMIYISVYLRTDHTDEFEKQFREYAHYIMHSFYPNVQPEAEIYVTVTASANTEHKNLYAFSEGESDVIEIFLYNRILTSTGSRRVTKEELLITLAHELVHAHQIIEGQLVMDTSDSRYTPDRDPIFEEEAYGLERPLYEKYWNKLNYLTA